MITLSRNDNSHLGRWWWTVDRLMLAMVLMLMVTGILMTFTASPAVAERNGVFSLYFFYRQMVFLIPSLFALFILSFMSTAWVRRISILGLISTIGVTIVMLVTGEPINGSTRWIRFMDISVQPSEFLKPFFIITTAWLLSACFTEEKNINRYVSFGLFALVAVLLVLQPDFGQTLLVGFVWVAQMTLAGLPLAGLFMALLLLMVGVGVTYVTMPYFAKRINDFFDPSQGDNYQVGLARDAFEAGGLSGRGPGEGTVKLVLPDAHSDYIFAVVGEEFGVLAGVCLIFLFAVIVLRGLLQLARENNPFRFLSVAGICIYFGLQTLINIGVNIDLLPSKGMTLPFVSYGGSSMLAMAISMGMVLALTRRDRVQPGTRENVMWRVER